MKHSFLRAALAVVAVLALCLASMYPPRVARAQQAANPIFTQIVSSTAASGNSSVLALTNQSNCTVVAQDSGTATITPQGTGGPPPITLSSIWLPNTNFGTNGSISVNSTITASPGNVTNLPAGFYFSWSSNNGTLTAYAVCTSGAVGSTDAFGNIKVVPAGTPLPTAAPIGNGPVGILCTAISASGLCAPASIWFTQLTVFSAVATATHPICTVTGTQSCYLGKMTVACTAASAPTCQVEYSTSPTGCAGLTAATAPLPAPSFGPYQEGQTLGAPLVSSSPGATLCFNNGGGTPVTTGTFWTAVF